MSKARKNRWNLLVVDFLPHGSEGKHYTLDISGNSSRQLVQQPPKSAHRKHSFSSVRAQYATHNMCHFAISIWICLRTHTHAHITLVILVKICSIFMHIHTMCEKHTADPAQNGVLMNTKFHPNSDTYLTRFCLSCSLCGGITQLLRPSARMPNLNS